MLKANLLETPFKKQMKAGAGDGSGILKPSKACNFFHFLYLLEHNLLPFA